MPDIRTHYPESSAGPAERICSVDCQNCYTKTELLEACVNCGDAICDTCAVRCATCGEGKVYRCVSCAIKAGFEERGVFWYCENCPLPENVLTKESVIL